MTKTWPALIALLGTLALAAPAAATTADFEDRADGTVIDEDHPEPAAAPGFYFLPASDVGISAPDCRFYTRVKASLAAHSGTQVASVADCGGPEFKDHFSAAFGVFTTFHKEVSLYAGFGSSAVPNPATATLRGYDINGTLVATDTRPVGLGALTQLAMTSQLTNIAFFDIAVDQTYPVTFNLLIDDLTYDDPVGALPPAFALARSGGISAVRVREGGTAAAIINVLRFNGSSGPVTLAMTDLPAGVSAHSFTPNPTSGTKSQLTIAGATSGPSGAADAQVSATGSAAAGPDPAPLTVRTEVVPAFDLFTNFGGANPKAGTVDVPSCTPVRERVQVIIEPGFLDLISLSASTSPRPLQVGVDPGTVSPGFNAFSDVTLYAPADDPKTSASVSVQASSGAYPLRLAGLTVTRSDGSVSAFRPGAGNPPAMLHPGTEVRLYGTGFCPGSKVEFGNDKAVAEPTSIDATPRYYANVLGGRLQTIEVRVPRLATTGKIKVVAGAHNVESAQEFRVDSFRSRDGFSFENPGGFHVTFKDVVDVFGYDQTHVTIDPCSWATLGLASCSVATTPIPDPGAVLYRDYVNDHAGDGGHCWGVALGAAWIRRGLRSRVPFSPAGASTTWALDAPAGASPALYGEINRLHLRQYSREVKLLRNLIGNAVETPPDLRAQIQGQLQLDRPPLISIYQDKSGHAVLAYDLEPGPDGGFYIDVYDPNRPYLGSEKGDGGQHQQREEDSRILVTAAGRWSFPALGWQGDLSTLTVTRQNQIPEGQPDLPGSLGDQLLLWVTSSGQPSQVTGPGGRTLLRADGSENDSSRTGIRGAGTFTPLDSRTRPNRGFVLPRGRYRTAIPGRKAYNATWVGKGSSVRVETGAARGAAAAARDPDVVTTDTRAASASFRSGAGPRSLALGVLARAPGGSQRSARLQTSGAASESLAFSRRRDGVSVKHSGRAAKLRIELSAADGRVIPGAFVSPSIRMRSGDVAELKPSNWGNLQQGRAVLTIRRKNGKRSRRVLRNSTRVKGSAQLAKPRARRVSGRLRVSASARVRVKRGASAMLAFTVTRGKRAVAHRVFSLETRDLGGRRKAFSWRSPKLPRGRYKVTASVLAVVPGAGTIQSSLSRRRSVRVR